MYMSNSDFIIPEKSQETVASLWATVTLISLKNLKSTVLYIAKQQWLNYLWRISLYTGNSLSNGDSIISEESL